MVVLVVIILLFYFADLIVCSIYCKKKKRHDYAKKVSENNMVQQGEGPAPNGMGAKVKALLNGWILFRLMCLGKVPSQKYRIMLLKYVFQMDIAERVVIYSWDIIRAPWNISIGEGTIVGSKASIDGRNFVTIGKNVNISTGINIYTEQHDVNDPYFRSLASGGEVIIADRAWISSHTIILPKVHVKEGAVLASGAVATKDLDAYGIYGGVPCKKIGERNKDLRYEFSGEYLPFI